MKVLILCGVFGEESYGEVIDSSRGGVEFSANILQQRLIRGFCDEGYDTDVISAPYIGAYPVRSNVFRFNGFSADNGAYKYVKFNNVWGIRNFSRALALKRALSDFTSLKDNKLIVVYGAHTPFLDAAAYVKKKDPTVKVCLYVPDLPQYMNLNASKSLVYTIAKRFDIRKMYGLMRYVDSFVLLTEQMKNILPTEEKPCFIAESVLSSGSYAKDATDRSGNEKYVVYTGKLNEKFGVKALIDSFEYIADRDFRLVLCGRGDCDSYAAEAAKRDPRIISLGQVSPEKAKEMQHSADVLVNPRPSTGEYTKYSFPSKIIEYLLTGNPVVSYMLDGMPKEYSSFIYEIKSGENEACEIARAINTAYEDFEENKLKKSRVFDLYAKNKLDGKKIAESIVSMNG